MAAVSAAEVDPRLKELARKADMAKLLRTLARNWPWVIAGVGLLWIAGVVIWMLLTPTPVVPPKGAMPIPMPVKKAPPVVPVKTEPKVEPAAVPEPPKAIEAPVEVKAFDEPAPLVPVADKPSAKNNHKEEVAINKWRLKMKNDLAFLDSRLTGELEQFRPALNTLAGDVEAVNNAQGQQSTEDRLKALKAKIETASETR